MPVRIGPWAPVVASLAAAFTLAADDDRRTNTPPAAAEEVVTIELDGLMQVRARRSGDLWHAAAAVRNARIAGQPARSRSGLIGAARGDGSGWRLEVRALLWPDGATNGRQAALTVELPSEPGADASGSYTGTVGEASVGGMARAQSRAAWPAAIPGWVPVAPGEHPRIIVRRTDLPDLRRRAATPEGQAVLRRAQEALRAAPFSTWHAAGHAFLYQATGQREHLRRCRRALDDALCGREDPDPAFTFAAPAAQSRAGPAIAAVALAYDLAYEGLDPAERLDVASRIQNHPHLQAIAERPDGAPGHHEFAVHQGSAVLALLAIRGDPGADPERVERWIEAILPRVRAELAHGFSEGGYYYQGHAAGRLAMNAGIAPCILACRTAAGWDLLSGTGRAPWLAARWIYEIARQGAERGPIATVLQRGAVPERAGRAGECGDFCQGFALCPEPLKPALLWQYNRVVDPAPEDVRAYDVGALPHRAAYALTHWPIGVQERNPADLLPLSFRDDQAGYYVLRNGWSNRHDIVVTALLGTQPQAAGGMARAGSVRVMGLGLVADFPAVFSESRLGLLETAPDGSAALSAVPLLADPADLLKVRRRDEVLAALTGGLPDGVDIGKEKLESMALSDDGRFREQFAAALARNPTRGVTAMAVDFSGRSGARALIVATGPYLGKAFGPVEYTSGGKKYTRMEVFETVPEPQRSRTGARAQSTPLLVDGIPYYVMTVHTGAAPLPNVRDGKIVIGNQTAFFNGARIVFGK